MSGLASTPSRGTPTYEEFYGLRQSPFSLAPDPQFLYLSESHEEALRLLVQSVRRKEAFIVLTGDIGTGKTTISRALMGQLDAATFTSLILNPFLSVDELLREILLDFGIISREEVRTGRVASASAHELTRTLHEFLLTLVPLSGNAVLIIDEAQHLSPEILEQLRVISNLETNTTRLLQIVLVGQRSLLDVLAQTELRQLDQRISLKTMLKPLTRAEVDAYIAHRLSVAQGSSAVRFEASALDAIHELTSGVPRPINLLCDRALMLGAHMSAGVITQAMVEDAARALDMHRRPLSTRAAGAVRTRRWILWSALALLLVSFAVVVLAPLHRLVDTPLPPLPPRPRMNAAPAARLVPVPIEIPAPPLRPRPLPAFGL